MSKTLQRWGEMTGLVLQWIWRAKFLEKCLEENESSSENTSPRIIARKEVQNRKWNCALAKIGEKKGRVATRMDVKNRYGEHGVWGEVARAHDTLPLFLVKPRWATIRLGPPGKGVGIYRSARLYQSFRAQEEQTECHLAWLLEGRQWGWEARPWRFECENKGESVVVPICHVTDLSFMDRGPVIPKLWKADKQWRPKVTSRVPKAPGRAAGRKEVRISIPS